MKRSGIRIPFRSPDEAQRNPGLGEGSAKREYRMIQVQLALSQEQPFRTGRVWSARRNIACYLKGATVVTVRESPDFVALNPGYARCTVMNALFLSRYIHELEPS